MTSTWLSRLAPAGPRPYRLGLGCRRLGGPAGPVPPLDAVRLVHYALDRGVRLLDIADFSSDGAVTRLVGAAIQSRRDDAIVAVHVGWPGTGWLSKGVRPGSPVTQCRRILARLRMDHVDVCYLRLPSGAAPVEELIGSLGQLVTAGRIRHLGIYALGGEDMLRAHATYPLTAVAADYSLWNRAAEAETVPVARRLGIGIVACGALDGGALAGLPPRPDRSPIEVSRLRRLQGIAASVNLSTGRLALAWLLGRGDDVVPVVGSVDRVHFEMDVSALTTRLPPATLRLLDDVFPAVPPR